MSVPGSQVTADTTGASATNGTSPQAHSSRLPFESLPGPDPMRVIGWRGNVASFFLDPIACLDNLAKHGRLVVMAKGMRGGVFRQAKDRSPGTVLAYGPDLLGKCFNSGHAQFRSIHMAPPPGRGFRRLVWGLQWLHGEQHRQHRKMIMPAFHPKRMERYRTEFVGAIERMLAGWKDGDTVDVCQETKRAIIEFLDRCFLSTGDSTGAISLGEQLEDVLFQRMLSLPVLLPLDFPLSPRRRATAHADRLSDLFEQVITRKRQERRSDDDDMFSLLIAARDEQDGALTDDQLIGHLAFLFGAGFESTRNSIAFAMYLIAQHPDVAAKLHDEVSSCLQGAAPTLQQLEQMPYLDAVIKESMRLLSAVPLLVRTTEEPVELGGYELPPRVEIILSMYHTHRMPELYPEPLRFRPERWETFKPTNYEYLPFSVGPHTCAGRALALMELKTMVAMIIQRFRLDLPRGVELNRRVRATLGPKEGMFMHVRKQDREFAHSKAPVRGSLAAMVQIDS